MFAGERELYERFAGYEDERLLRILTAERAKYRREALAAAEMVLAERGVEPPTLFAAPQPPATLRPPAAHGPGRARPKSPYQFIDLIFDVLLVALVCWALVKLWAWTMASSWVWSQAIFYILAARLLGSAVALRRRWRAKEW